MKNSKSLMAVTHTHTHGITLIALIITIIVMLILVGVTINFALNGGIITKSKTASLEMQKAADREELQLAVISSMDYVTGKVVRQDLVSSLSNGWNVTSEAPYTCTSPSNNVFTVTEDGVITEAGASAGEQDPDLAYLRSLIGSTIGDIYDVEASQQAQDMIFKIDGLSISEQYDFSPSVDEDGNYVFILEYKGVVYSFYFRYDNSMQTELDMELVNVTKGAYGEEENQNQNQNQNQDQLQADMDFLETYILGSEKIGRDRDEILLISNNSYSFIDDVTTENIDESSSLIFKNAAGDGNLIYWYFSYNGRTYRFLDNNGYTEPLSQNEKIKRIDSSSDSNVGTTITIDGINFIVLYGEGEKTSGAQLIADDGMMYDDSVFELRNAVDWTDSDVISETNIFNDDSLYADGLSDVEKSIYWYNHAIEILNDKCDEVIREELSSSTLNKIADVRCVGSNPTSKNALIRREGEGDYYTSEILANLAGSNEAYPSGYLNGVLKNSDINYLDDFDRMLKYSLIRCTNNSTYYLATRVVRTYETNYGGDVSYRLPYISGRYMVTGYSNTSDQGMYLRPVIILQPGALAELLGE